MTKKQVFTVLSILFLAYAAIEGFIFSRQSIGMEWTMMALAIASMLLLLWQLARVIRTVNFYKRAVEGMQTRQLQKQLLRWNPEAAAPSSLAAIPAVFFGRRTYTWEEIMLSYAFLGGVILAIRFLLLMVH